MILRLAELALLGSLAFRFGSGQWPWVWWQMRAARALEVRARALLGVAPDAGRAAIIAAHRRLIAQIHPDRGGSSAAVCEANDARDLLLQRCGADKHG